MEKQLTYQELLTAYNKLLKENESLHKEINKLQAFGQQGYFPDTTRHKATFVF